MTAPTIVLLTDRVVDPASPAARALERELAEIASVPAVIWHGPERTSVRAPGVDEDIARGESCARRSVEAARVARRLVAHADAPRTAGPLRSLDPVSSDTGLVVVDRADPRHGPGPLLAALERLASARGSAEAPVAILVGSEIGGMAPPATIDPWLASAVERGLASTVWTLALPERRAEDALAVFLELLRDGRVAPLDGAPVGCAAIVVDRVDPDSVLAARELAWLRARGGDLEGPCAPLSVEPEAVLAALHDTVAELEARGESGVEGAGWDARLVLVEQLDRLVGSRGATACEWRELLRALVGADTAADREELAESGQAGRWRSHARLALIPLGFVAGHLAAPILAAPPMASSIVGGLVAAVAAVAWKELDERRRREGRGLEEFVRSARGLLAVLDDWTAGAREAIDLALDEAALREASEAAPSEHSADAPHLRLALADLVGTPPIPERPGDDAPAVTGSTAARQRGREAVASARRARDRAEDGGEHLRRVVGSRLDALRRSIAVEEEALGEPRRRVELVGSRLLADESVAAERVDDEGLLAIVAWRGPSVPGGRAVDA